MSSRYSLVLLLALLAVAPSPSGGLTRARVLCDNITTPIGIAVADDGRVFVADDDVSSEGLRSAQGDIFAFPPTATVSRSISANGEMIVDTSGDLYVSSGGNGIDRGNFVVEYDAGGQRMRSLSVGTGDVPGPIALDGDGNLYVGFSNLQSAANSIRAYRPGVSTPFRNIAVPSSPSALATDATSLYAALVGTQADGIAVYTLSRGKLVRKLRANPAYPAAMAVDRSGRLYVPADANGLGVNVFTNGTQSQTIATGAPPLGFAFSSSGDLYVQTKSSVEVFAASDMTHAFTLLSTGGPIGIDAQRQELYVGTDGGVYVYRIPEHAAAVQGILASTGAPSQPVAQLSVTNVTVPENPKNVAGIAMLSDGTMWIAGSSVVAGSLYADAIRPGGATQAYGLPGSATMSVQAAAAARDGALWFVSASPDVVGRVALDGTFTHYALPGNTSPSSIALGPDGAMWIAEYGANKIGRIAADGTMTHYDVPVKDGHPKTIAAGPDGALWFIEIGSDGSTGIVRMTADGTMTPQKANGTITALTNAADGSLWFTQTNPSAIGAVSPDGTIQRQLIDNCTIAPFGILAVHDDDIWFWDRSGAVRRMTVDGKLDETVAAQLPIYSGFPPGGIRSMVTPVVSNANGTAWFRNRDALGRIDLSSSP